MRYLLILCAILIVGCNDKNNISENPILEPSSDIDNSTAPISYDFESDSLGYDSPEEVAIQVISYLQTKDTISYFEAAIPLSAQKYLFAQNFEFRPDIEDQKAYMKWLSSRFERRMNNFLVRAAYIEDIMLEDKDFQINLATVDTITFKNKRIKSYGGFDRHIVGDWADVTVKMKYNNQDFFFEIPQIIKLKDKWFLYYPEYYIRTTRDLEFTKRRVKEINEKADEFWL